MIAQVKTRAKAKILAKQIKTLVLDKADARVKAHVK